MFLAETPSIDGNEIADKSYINERAVPNRRAHPVERLHSEPADPRVVRTSEAAGTAMS